MIGASAWDIFLMTIAVGAGGCVSITFGLACFALLGRWCGFLDNGIKAMKRYASRDMVINEYYTQEQMLHVRQFREVTPHKVEITKRNKGKA